MHPKVVIILIPQIPQGQQGNIPTVKSGLLEDLLLVRNIFFSAVDVK
jgi:hypothetical protein